MPVTQMLSWCGMTGAAPWLTRTARTAVADLVAARAETADAHAGPGQVHERLALEMMGHGHATYDAIARQLWGVPVHAPFLDTPLVDVCHAIPGWQRARPGDFKPLARAAFTGSVPAAQDHILVAPHHYAVESDRPAILARQPSWRLPGEFPAVRVSRLRGSRQAPCWIVQQVSGHPASHGQDRDACDGTKSEAA
ncbi:asparagine synthase-related protein [Streptomyces misionensis]|uniref:asparagine synthase-related protein n=1 Tax=Streptomyces misionensis TaxID=67331 RepID=UPI0033C71912